MKIAASVFFVALCMKSSLLFACSCGGSGQLNTCKLVIPASQSVFLGTVISIQPAENRNAAEERVLWPAINVRFSVQESYNGVQTNEVEVSTPKGGSACGYPFQIGHSYLVFADEYEGKLSTSHCSATQPARTAAALIQQYQAIKSGRPPASVFGFVSRLPRDNSIEGRELHTPIVGAMIKVLGRGGSLYSTESNGAGTYEFRDLPPDRYEIQPILPHGLRLRDFSGGKPLTANVENITSSCWIDLIAEPDSKISGRVQSPDGQSAQAFVTLDPVDPEEQREALKKGGLVGFETGPDGRFELSPVWPGRYRLRLVPKTDGRVDFRNKCYYPGTVEVAEGQQIDSIVFQVCATTNK